MNLSFSRSILATFFLAGPVMSFQNCSPSNPPATAQRLVARAPSSFGLPSTTAAPTAAAVAPTTTVNSLPSSTTTPAALPTGNLTTMPTNPVTPTAPALPTVRCEPDSVIRMLKNLPPTTDLDGGRTAKKMASDIDDACDTIWWLEEDALPQVVATCNASGGLPVANCSCEQLFVQCLE